jgi:hypothetical protein
MSWAKVQRISHLKKTVNTSHQHVVVVNVFIKILKHGEFLFLSSLLIIWGKLLNTFSYENDVYIFRRMSMLRQQQRLVKKIFFFSFRYTSFVNKQKTPRVWLNLCEKAAKIEFMQIKIEN